MRTPPTDVSPARLFRELASVARRPRWRVSFADLALPDLIVEALPGHELEDVMPIGEHLDEQRQDVVLDELVVRCLRNPDGSPAFSSRAQFGLAPYEDALAISNEVFRALCIVAPIYGRSDLKSWHGVLREGALHPSNYALRRAIIESATHLAMTAHFQPQPDRYFGMPLGYITDGQWLAFDAAWSTRG
jgi:hypothetical protein